MKKFLILPALALFMTVGVFTLGQQSKSAYAAGPTVQTQNQINKPEIVSTEKPSGSETGTEVKGTEIDALDGHQDANNVQDASEKVSEPKSTEADGPGGHQDAQGANVNHQFNGNE